MTLRRLLRLSAASSELCISIYNVEDSFENSKLSQVTHYGCIQRIDDRNRSRDGFCQPG